MAAGQRGKTIHRALHDAGRRQVVRIYRFPRLKEGVGVLGRAADDGSFGTQPALAVGADEIVVDHGADLLVRQHHDRVELVRGAEPVHEMDERHPRLQSRRLRHQREIVRLLHRCRAEQSETGRAHRHDVRMVAEDRQRLGADGARGNMEDARRKLARDLEHVGDHQEEALRGGEGCRQRAALQRAVDRAGGAAFGLHLLDDGDGAPQVRPAFRRPFVGKLRHRRRRRDRKDRAHLVDAVGNVSDSAVAVEGLDPVHDRLPPYAPVTREGESGAARAARQTHRAAPSPTGLRASSRWRGSGIARSRSRTRCTDRALPDSLARGREG